MEQLCHLYRDILLQNFTSISRTPLGLPDTSDDP
jgi:hypothetical protein